MTCLYLFWTNGDTAFYPILFFDLFYKIIPTLLKIQKKFHNRSQMSLFPEFFLLLPSRQSNLEQELEHPGLQHLLLKSWKTGQQRVQYWKVKTQYGLAALGECNACNWEIGLNLKPYQFNLQVNVYIRGRAGTSVSSKCLYKHFPLPRSQMKWTVKLHLSEPGSLNHEASRI